MVVNKEKSWLCWDERKLVRLFQKKPGFILEMQCEMHLFVPAPCEAMAVLCSHCSLAALTQQ